jgi:amidase
MPDFIFLESLTLGGRGLRVGIKDSIDIAGYPTIGASASLAEEAPALRNADVVQAVLDAGCRIVGKTNMHELAYGVTGINAWTGTPTNPLFPGRIPGGSSSGSAAAVAAGYCDFTLGTDTGGSIRMPAACCGVFGFKPSFGRVSRKGAVPAISSLDCVGPFAGSVAMIVQAMAIIDPSFRIAARPATIRLGRVVCDADPAIDEAFEASLKASGVEIVPVELPQLAKAFAANIAIIGAETWAGFGHLLATGRVGPDVAARLINASKVTATQLADAEAARTAFRAEVDAALEGVDALVLPTLPAFPMTIADAADAVASLRLTALVRPFNLSGHPAITLPIPAAQRLPVGIQLVGRIGEDAALCAVAGTLASRIETIAPLQGQHA